MDTMTALLDERAVSDLSETVADVARIPSACPACESVDLLCEADLDKDGMPTGLVLITCTVCGRELGELAPPRPGPKAEPEALERSLLPGPWEERREMSGPHMVRSSR